MGQQLLELRMVYVDVLDLQAVAQHWNEARTADNQQVDLNWDGRIDVRDILLTAAAWGQTCPIR